MSEDKFALVEKILKDVDFVLSKNELSSFDIVPVDFNIQNKSPVLHIENSLGLESWCIKHVYMYCYSELAENHFSKPKLKVSKLISTNSERLVRLLNVTLLINPEITTFWNKRRELVEKKLLDKMFELQFLKLVLSRKPKCNDAFSYRRWLLDLIFNDLSLQSHNLEDLVNEELRICQSSSEISPNNYHSWNHRSWFINKLNTIAKLIDIDFLYIKEYEFSDRWAPKHISDYSCFHYRQLCLKNLFKISNQSWKKLENCIDINLRKEFVTILQKNLPNDFKLFLSEDKLISSSEEELIKILFTNTFKNCSCSDNKVLFCRKLELLFHELILSNELIQFYKHHETLWYHRRFIVHEILMALYDYYGVMKQNNMLVKILCRECNSDDNRQMYAKIGRYDSNNVYSSPLFMVLLTHEHKFIDERRNDSDNYADRHKKYLKFVEHLSNFV